MKWISVKDRLPEEQGDVLITDGSTQMVCYFLVDFHSVWGLGEVTHWMPLPEPPK